MKFLCLAYGAEADWKALSPSEQDELLAQDEVLRRRGDVVAALGPATTVRAWDGEPRISRGSFPESNPPLAGFGIIEAESLEEAVRLVTATPCARAKGAVVLRPITASNLQSGGSVNRVD